MDQTKFPSQFLDKPLEKDPDENYSALSNSLKLSGLPGKSHCHFSKSEL